MGKNVAVFVDVANIFYAAKAAGVDIDYVLLLKSATAGRDLVRAYAYTGLDPDNENQRNFHSFLARNNFKVVSKDIRKYGDGKVKANLDIELVVDLMKTSRNLDVAVVVSGDGDFAPAIRAVQETGVRVEVISFRGNTSSDLMDVADKFTDITQLAKVEKGSTTSGRRVATSDEDLSMTEVPDKESEGTGRGRGRGRGRARVRPVEAPIEEPVAAAPSGAALVALPGEKLSKAAPAKAASGRRSAAKAAPVVAASAVEEEIEDLAAGEPVEGETEAEGEERRRRRRRRGGRGRGRGRGQEQGELEGAPGTEELVVSLAEDEEDEEAAEPARPVVRPAAFGSVWDSQIGVPSAPRATAPLDDEEYDDEPAIPEYLLAERRRGGRGAAQGGAGGQRGRGGQRGGRAGAYAAAVERERYGGRGPSRLSEPAGRGGRGGPGAPRSDQRPARPGQPSPARDRGPERRPSSEPWSEVPPELEELLRAQLAQKAARQESPAAAPEATTGDAPAAPKRRTTRKPATATAAPAEPVATTGTPAPKRRTRSTSSAPEATTGDAPAAPKRRTTRKPATATAAPAEPVATTGTPAPKRRTRSTSSAPEATTGDAPAAPKRRTTRKPATATAAPAEPVATTGTPAPKRRTRKPAAETPTEGA